MFRNVGLNHLLGRQTDWTLNVISSRRNKQVSSPSTRITIVASDILPLSGRRKTGQADDVKHIKRSFILFFYFFLITIIAKGISIKSVHISRSELSFYNELFSFIYIYIYSALMSEVTDVRGHCQRTAGRQKKVLPHPYSYR